MLKSVNQKFISLSKEWNFLSSAKLQASVYSGRNNKPFKYILKRRRPKTDP